MFVVRPRERTARGVRLYNRRTRASCSPACRLYAHSVCYCRPCTPGRHVGIIRYNNMYIITLVYPDDDDNYRSTAIAEWDEGLMTVKCIICDQRIYIYIYMPYDLPQREENNIIEYQHTYIRQYYYYYYVIICLNNVIVFVPLLCGRTVGRITHIRYANY